jgi:hypothetical protein
MALSKREKLIAIGVGVAAVVFAGDRYVLTPYVYARKEVTDDLTATSNKLREANSRLTRARRMDRDWRDMEAGAGGVKTDQSAAQFQVLEAVGEYAREAGVNLNSRTPQPENRNDRTQVLRLHAIGTCNTASAARLLWRVETAPIPLKVDEITLSSTKPGNDDLTINLMVSTIWVKPQDPKDAKNAAQPVRRAPAGDEGT